MRLQIVKLSFSSRTKQQPIMSLMLSGLPDVPVHSVTSALSLHVRDVSLPLSVCLSALNQPPPLLFLLLSPSQLVSLPLHLSILLFILCLYLSASFLLPNSLYICMCIYVYLHTYMCLCERAWGVCVCVFPCVVRVSVRACGACACMCVCVRVEFVEFRSTIFLQD